MAANPPEVTRAHQEIQPVSAADLSASHIRKQVFLDKVQDRGSLLPLGLSGMALIYALLYAPILGGLLASLVVFVLAGVVGASFLVWQFAFRYQQNYALKSQELVAFYEARTLFMEEHRLKGINRELQEGFTEIKFTPGLNTLHRLEHEYQELQPVLTTGKETDLLSLANVESLVNETYYRGLSVLQDVFELERAIRSTNNTQLQAEVSDLEKKAAGMRDDPAQKDRLAQINERIHSNQERLHIVRKLRQRVEELLYQAGRCEASLGKTRIELAALKADASEMGVNAVTETLRRTIDRAMAVQEELKKMGY